jgi:PDDEXK-like domain of unknown function (DUF3799)
VTNEPEPRPDTRPVQITEPGVYTMDPETYHRDPVPIGSLSASGIKLLLPPSSPAKFHYHQTHPRADTDAFDLGHAVHADVLGVGAPIAVIPHETWNTKAAKAAVAEARAAGKTPLKPKVAEQVKAMADAVRAHPEAARLLTPGRGRAEQALFDIDPVTGIWKRAMVDWLPEPDDDGQVTIVDLKTTVAANIAAVSRHLYDFGYYQQAPWYMDLVDSLGLSPHYEPTFVFVFVEKEPPHLVSVAQPDPDSIEWGRVRNRKALDTYRECMENDEWPGYPTGVQSVGLPRYAQYELERTADAGWYETREDREDML